MNIRNIWPAALLLAFGASPARGALLYSLAAEQSSYTAVVGDTVDIRIYLVETATDGEASQLMGTDAGLISAGFRLEYGSTDPAQVLADDDITPNGAFDSPFTLAKAALPGSASLREDVDFGSPAAQGVGTGPGMVALWLGTFRFTVGAAGLTVVSIQDYDQDPQFVNFTTAAFVDLDPSIQAGRFTINATRPGVIPEPASLVMAATAALGLLQLAARRSSR